MKTLSMSYISSFCLSLHLTAASGIPLSEGVLLYAADESDGRIKSALSGVYDALEAGTPLFLALRDCGLFPLYMTDMVEVGERTGKLDDVLMSLSNYYDRQQQLRNTIRSAVLYPVVLLAIILMVVVLFIVKVLPIFEDVYGQLGAVMTGPAVLMLCAGEWMGNNATVLLAVLAAFILFFAWLLAAPARRSATGRFAGRLLGGRELTNTLSAASFSSVMAMALASGMDVDESLEMTQRLSSDDTELKTKLVACQGLISSGESFAPAIAVSGILTALYARTLAVGMRTGSVDTVMSEIARRSSNDAEQRIDTAVSRIEPCLVVLMSMLVGLILLSVMLPLASIMSAL